MSIITPSPLRHTLTRLPHPILTQRRFARVHDVRFVTTNQQSNTIHEKYKAKLERKAREEGLKSVSELKEAYKDKIQETRKKAATIPLSTTAATATTSKQSFQQPPPPPPQPKHAAQQPDQPSSSTSPSITTTSAPETGIKPLSSFIDLPKIATLPLKEIELIWRLRFASSPLSLCAVIPLSTYQRIHAVARRHPQFILPLPRPSADDGSGDIKTSASGFEGGAERTAADVHFLQWGFHPPASAPVDSGEAGKKSSNTHTSTVIFTHLAAFKLHGAYAQPHTTITHHLDLADSHGIVLLNGAVVDGRGVSVEEGRWLLMCLQKFYDFEGHGGGVGKEKRQGLLEKFSKGDADFSLEELVDEAERIS